VRVVAINAVTQLIEDEDHAHVLETFVARFQLRMLELLSEDDPAVVLAGVALVRKLLSGGHVALGQLTHITQCASHPCAAILCATIHHGFVSVCNASVVLAGVASVRKLLDGGHVALGQLTHITQCALCLWSTLHALHNETNAGCKLVGGGLIALGLLRTSLRALHTPALGHVAPHATVALRVNTAVVPAGVTLVRKLLYGGHGALGQLSHITQCALLLYGARGCVFCCCFL
jgi:hypothetical protein